MAKQHKGSVVDTLLMAVVWPIMAVQAACAFVLVCAFNILAAVAKTCKGEIIK